MTINVNDMGSILIVDDDVVILNMLESFFMRERFQCETASSAESAIKLFEQNEFDIMITDIGMPGMSGLELTRIAKKTRPAMIVLVMTGLVDQFSYDSALEAGAADFIKKPFSLQEVQVRIKQALMHRQIHELSLTDELSGLYNRRGFFTLIDHLLKMEKRKNKGFFLLYIDVDNLKTINDTWGHKEGDAALMEIAGILKSVYRESDVVARMGGDEFVVVPISADRESADTIACRLKNKIDLEYAKGNRSYKLSVSTGLAYFDSDNPCSVEELLSKADEAMYEVKKIKRAKTGNHSL